VTSLYKDPAMEKLITRTIRAAMAQDGLTYAGLSGALLEKGIIQSESTLRSKVNNGTLGATLFLHIMSCTSVRSLEFESVMTKYDNIKKTL